MTSKASHDAYDMLINLRDKLTRLHGVITPDAVDKLVDELGGILTVAKTHHYAHGQKYGHLASTIPEAKYRLVINDATWTHTVPTDPGAYSTDALGVGNAAATRKQFVKQHKIKQKSYSDYLSVEEAGKELILYASRLRCLCPPQEIIHRIRRHHRPPDDRPLTLKNSNQDDDRAKIRVQVDGLQQPVGPNDEYHRVLHAARSLPSLSWGPRHRNERPGKNHGSRRANVAVQDVHRGPNGRLGKQTRGGPD